jgi:hypothetical protein
MFYRPTRPLEKARDFDLLDFLLRSVVAFECGLIAGVIVQFFTLSPIVCSSVVFLTIPFIWCGMGWLLHGGWASIARSMSDFAGGIFHRAKEPLKRTFELAADLSGADDA